jgi:hypothetical protein
MSSAQERNIRFYEAGYLNALKKGLEGLEDKSVRVQDSNYYDDNHRDNGSSSSSDDEIQTRSKTAKKTEKRNERNARKQQQQTAAARKQQQQHNVAPSVQQESSSPIIEKKKQKKLTKRQQVLQRYADEEACGIASVLASMADAAVTRSQARNRNTVMWTESDRAAASRAAAITLEVATLAAEAAKGKKKKEQPSPYWTRFHEKNRSTVRFQKEMERVFECDFI